MKYCFSLEEFVKPNYPQFLNLGVYHRQLQDRQICGRTEMIHFFHRFTKLNFDFVTPEADVGGQKLPNGTWTGIMALFASKKIDAAFREFVPSKDRQEILVFGHSVTFNDGLGVLEKTWRRQFHFQLWNIFEVLVWVLFALAFLFFFVSVKHFRPKLLSLKLNSKNSGHVTSAILFKSLEILFNSGFQLGFRQRILWFVWVLFCFLITALFKNELQSCLIVEKEYKPTWDELKASVKVVTHKAYFFKHHIEKEWGETKTNILIDKIYSRKTVLKKHLKNNS